MAATTITASSLVLFAALLIIGTASAVNNLLSGQTLQTGESLYDQNYNFTIQEDCNGVLFQRNANNEGGPPQAVWETGTAGLGTYCSLTLQVTGTITIQSGNGTVVWRNEVDSGRPTGNYILILDYNRNLVVYGYPTYSTNTGSSVPAAQTPN